MFACAMRVMPVHDVLGRSNTGASKFAAVSCGAAVGGWLLSIGESILYSRIDLRARTGAQIG